ncbi:hypothetical protein GKE82_24605 [Conexibacter sp. W3-3-2]|uniref:peptidylprolyl isomerase n=1 Tax=Conexibacter sp. W3-3-2 TaxID=2675227 RepID=UPI0012B7365A|nr:peptidylprolyl isomerase [Conexibacter sp. W3-3-2]MTD47126.1 hypothetical protein [Conexibacter sp. W3-3-2]MTD47390.1 hypothetical protein [Conexibacter sp. W3-3-2]
MPPLRLLASTAAVVSILTLAACGSGSAELPADVAVRVADVEVATADMDATIAAAQRQITAGQRNGTRQLPAKARDALADGLRIQVAHLAVLLADAKKRGISADTKGHSVIYPYPKGTPKAITDLALKAEAIAEPLLDAIAPQRPVTGERIEQFYDQNLDIRYRRPAAATLAVLTVRDRATAERLTTQLPDQPGPELRDLVCRNTMLPQECMEAGGLRLTVPLEKLEDDLARAVKRTRQSREAFGPLQVQTSPPDQPPMVGWRIGRVMEYLPEQTTPLARVRAQLKGELEGAEAERRQTVLRDYLKRTYGDQLACHATCTSPTETATP